MAHLVAPRKAAVGLAKSFEGGPQFISYGAFTMDAGGLTQEATKGRGDSATTETVWIAAPFEILGLARDPHGRSWGKWLRWRDADGRVHVQHVALSGWASSIRLPAFYTVSGKMLGTLLCSQKSVDRLPFPFRKPAHESKHWRFSIVTAKLLLPV